MHCVRHRRTLGTEDQFAGQQKNLNQEYINVTRGVNKTCMWVELQPFGHPGDPREPSEGHFDDNCRKYAEARSGHISQKQLPFATLTSEEDLFK